MCFAACKKEGTPAPDPVSTDDELHVSAIIGEYPTVYDSTSYTYNNDMSLKAYYNYWKLSTSTSPTITPLSAYYKNGKLTGVYKTDVQGTDTIFGTLFSYNSAGQMIRLTYVILAGRYDSLVYNSNGQLAERYLLHSSSPIDDVKLTFTYENNNVVKAVYDYISDMNLSYDVVHTYKYDNKKSYYKGIRPWFYSLNSYYWMSENNPVEEVITQGQIVDTITYQYEYNNKDYPVSANVKSVHKDAGGTTIQTSTTRIYYLQK